MIVLVSKHHLRRRETEQKQPSLGYPPVIQSTTSHTFQSPESSFKVVSDCTWHKSYWVLFLRAQRICIDEILTTESASVWLQISINAASCDYKINRHSKQTCGTCVHKSVLVELSK